MGGEEKWAITLWSSGAGTVMLEWEGGSLEWCI